MFIVEKSRLKGEVQLPTSKSQSLRAILFALLAKGTSYIDSLLPSPDVEAAKRAFCLLGGTIDGNSFTAPEKMNEAVIDVGNSGILLRFLSAIAALGTCPIKITGDHSIQTRRPMDQLLKALQELGVSAQSERPPNGAPVMIQGPMKRGVATLSGHDSQPVSALLIAGAFSNGIELHVHNPGEKPWIDLTLSWLNRFSISYINRDYSYYKVEWGAAIPGFSYTVPGDLSSMAFPIVASLITESTITIHGVDLNEPQGDKEILPILKAMGAKISYGINSITIHPSHLRGIEVDINGCIDSIAALAALSCYVEGKTVIRNAAVAREKECDRISALYSELKKMGAEIEELEDGLIIQGAPLKGASLFSHHDHRMAMALTVAALGASGKTTIHETACVAKTFPGFAAMMKQLGGSVLEIV